MEGLKFHNTISLPLEKITQERGTRAFTADEIDAGAFVDAMLNVLCLNPKMLPLYSAFFSKSNELHGKHKHDISYEEAKSLYETFKAIADECPVDK